MPVFVACPSCNTRLGLPDTFSSGNVKCPKCGSTNRLTGPGAAKPSAPSNPAQQAARPVVAAPKPQQPAPPSYFDDFDEPAQPLAAPAAPVGMRRSSRQVEEEKPKSTLPIILGIGGGAALVLAAVMGVVVMQQPGPNDALPSAAPRTDVVETAQTDAGQPAPSRIGPGMVQPNQGQTTGAQYPIASIDYGGSPLPRDRVYAAITDATVFIKLKVDGKDYATGSGFVIRNDAGKTYVASNRHVVTLHSEEDADEEDDDGPSTAKAKPKPKGAVTVSCVFRSGERGKEQEVPAKILAADTSGDTTRDLSVLLCENVSQPPQPISFTRAEPTLGTPLLFFGFPGGKQYNIVRNGNPSITTNKGSISQLEKDMGGNIAMLKVDGNLDPGNSGGPIVDEGGQLVGVAVAKSSLADGIGFVIPRSHVEQLLAGRVAKIGLQVVSIKNGSYEFDVKADLTDPMGQLRDAQVRIAPLYGEPPKPETITKIEEMKDVKPTALAVDHKANVASARFSVPLANTPKNVFVQLSFTSGNGMKFLSVPMPHSLPGQPGKLVAMGDRDELMKKFKNLVTGAFKKLQKLIDPDKDCKLVKEGKAIKIEVPAGCHTLLPEIAVKKIGLNAPRTLAKVEGDFVMHALIGGALNPGTDRVKNPRNQQLLKWTFHSAGLLLWEDEKNFIRLERTASVTARGAFLEHRLLVEVYKNGKLVGEPYWFNVQDGPMHLLMARNNGLIQCMFMEESDQRWKAFREFAVDFPNNIQVGLSAVNMSKKSLSAVFSEFILFDKKDQAQLEEELKKLQ